MNSYKLIDGLDKIRDALEGAPADALASDLRKPTFHQVTAP